MREVEFNGIKAKYVSIKISDEDGNYFINVPLMTQKGGINNYVKSLVRYLPNIDLKRKVVINPAHARKGDQYAPGIFLSHMLGKLLMEGMSLSSNIIRTGRMDGLTELRVLI